MARRLRASRPLVRPHPPPDLPRRRRPGLHRPGAGRDAAPRRRRPRRASRRPGAARRPAALRPEGQERHLDLPLRRRQPPGDLRPKPALNKYAGKTFDATALPRPASSRRCSASARGPSSATTGPTPRSSRSRSASRSTAEAGVEISDWWPHLAACVDDIAFVRSMYTTDNDHAAEFQMHHGRHMLDEQQPVLGSWIHYGLGTLTRTCRSSSSSASTRTRASSEDFAADYLGPQYAGVELSLDPSNPLPFGTRGQGRARPRSRQNEFAFIRELNRLVGGRVPRGRPAAGADQGVRAGLPDADGRCPRSLDLDRETAETQRLYGIDNATHGRSTAAGCSPPAGWPSAASGSRWSTSATTASGTRTPSCKNLHARSCARVDQPIAGLLKDLKRTGPGPTTSRSSAAPSSAARPGLEVRDGYKSRPAATTTRTASRSGSPARGSRAASSTARPTSWASTRSSTRTTSPTSTPRCCTGSASTRAGSTSPAASGWTSTTARRSGRF